MGNQKKGDIRTYKTRVTENANKDFRGLTNYIELVNFQPLNSLKVGESIISVINQIFLNPFSFKECKYLPTKSKMYRQVLCLSWYIIYRIADDEIVILGIIHSARKPSQIKKLRSIK